MWTRSVAGGFDIAADPRQSALDQDVFWSPQANPAVLFVAPTLIGVFVGRWLDRIFDSGVFWSAALIFVGVSIGFWAAWRWMHTEG